MNRFNIIDPSIINCSLIEKEDIESIYKNGGLKSINRDVEFSNDISAISDRIETRLKKRMSDLSKGIYSVLDSINSKNKISRDETIWFFTGYGEIETTKRIIHGLMVEEATLVSPTDFHNSVHNTPLSYFTIVNQLHNHSITVSDGNRTGDTFIKVLENMAITGDGGIICSGEEGSDFFMLDKSANNRKIVSSFCGFRVTVAEGRGGRFAGDFETLDELLVSDVFKQAETVYCDINFISTIKKSGKEIITEYAICGESPCSVIYRVVLPFYLNKGGIVIFESNGMIKVIEVDL